MTREQRRATRTKPRRTSRLAAMRLRTGGELRVVDISSEGALVEGLPRLLPGHAVELRLTTPHGRLAVRARVVRSSVCAIGPALVVYRSGVAFELPLDVSALEECSNGTAG